MASRKFLVPANLLNLAEDPVSGESGDIYFNTTSDKLKIYDGSAWVEVGSSGGSAITVSDTAPSSPTTGDAWYDNTTGSFYVYDGTFWVEVNGVVATESFKTIAVSGQSDIVADTTTDTLTFVAGTNVSITTNATNDSITINSTGDYTSVDSITYPDYITFDTTPEIIPTEQGSIYWDSGDTGLRVLANNTSILLGQEQYATVKNATGSSIAKGKVVYINGAQGQRPTIALADADAESTSSKTFGITAEAIADGAEGVVTTEGILRGLNTAGLTEGGAIWLSSTAGNFTQTIPTQPVHSVFLGYVVKAHASSGEIFVKIQNGYELNELHNVLINGVSDSHALVYDSSTSLWKNKLQEDVLLKVYNNTGSSIPALSPVYYLEDTVNGINVAIADADSSLDPNKLPAIGITKNAIAHESSGVIVTYGKIVNVNTFDFNSNDSLYVASGGGLTSTRPTGTANVQEVGKVIVGESLSDGQILVYNTGRKNDIPNLDEGKLWLGNVTAYPVATTLDTSIVPEGVSGPYYFTDEKARTALSADLGGTAGGIRIIAPTSASDATLSNDSATHQVVVGPSGSGTNIKGTMSILSSSSISDPGNLGVAGNIDAEGSVTGSSIVKDGGTSSEFLKADGSVDSSTYLTTEADPVFSASDAAGISATDISNWDTAYGWGDHSIAGYALSSHNHTLDSLSNVVITGTPTDGQVIAWDTTTSKWVNESASGGSAVTVSSTAPTSPAIGDAWFKNDTGEFYIYDGTYWVEVNGVIAGDTLPDQTGNDGKFLQTDGTVFSWQDVDLTNYVTLDGAQTISGIKKINSWLNFIAPSYWNEADFGTGRIEYNAMSDRFQIIAYPTVGKPGGETGGRLHLAATEDIVIYSGSGEVYLTNPDPDNQIVKVGDLTLENVTDGGATSSNAITISNTTQSTTPTSGALIISGGVGIAKDVWIDGDLHVNGTTITENTQTVATHDNMIYLNAAQDSTITNAVGDGTYVTYTAENNYTPGMDIRVTGMDPSGYNIASADGLTVYSATSTQFVVAKTTTGSFVSGGIAHAKEEVNPDLGFAGGYYNAGYAHAGLFRDATDGVFKFFTGYTPEPDEAVNIDTTHASFALADISVNNIQLDGTINFDVVGGTPTGSISIMNGPGYDQLRVSASDWLSLSATNNVSLGTVNGWVSINSGDYVVISGTNGTFLNSSLDSNNQIATIGDLSSYAPLSSPTFTGTVSGITKSMVGLGDVENTTLSTWAGSTNLTTLGTITSGSWNGTEIGYAYGGTGLTTLGTAGQVLKVNATEDGLEWGTGGGGGLSTTTTSITTNSATAIESFDKTVSRTAEAIIQITQGTDYYSSKALLIHDGTNVKITEYAILESTTGAIPVTISAAISGSNLELRATITDAASTNATAKVVLIEVGV